MKLKLRCWLLVLVALGMVGCTAIVPTTPTFVPTITTIPLPKLAEILQLSEIRSISLQDDWTGGIVSNQEVHYSLIPDKTTFTGQVDFKVRADDNIPPVRDRQPLHIPINNINRFINELMKTQFAQGIYKPSIKWNFDYPHLEIVIELRAGRLSFYSDSQGENHIPWGMSYNNKTYIVNNTAPTVAMNILAPYLKKERLKELEDQIRKEPNLFNATSQPTMTP